MNRIIFHLILILLPLSILAVPPKEKTTSTTIKGNLFFAVDQKHVKANLQYQYVSGKNDISQISFYLTKDVNIEKLEGEAIENYIFDREAEPFGTLTITFKNPLKFGNVTSFIISYSGELSQGFWTENYNWIDIDPDFMILPLFTDLQSFNYEIHAKLNNPSYEFVDSRNEKMSSTLNIKADSVFYFESVVAGNKMKFDKFIKGDYTINIISNKTDSIVKSLANTSAEILTYFNETIGQKSKIKDFTVLYRPLPDSVFRTIRSLTDVRFIMFSNNHERIPTLAHEISHFWWNRGNDFTMEKWLDESFAEYSKLMYIRDMQGQTNFQKEINRLEEESQNLPPLIGSDRFVLNWSKILYEKGPYLLYQLEEILGKKKFIQLLCNLNEENVSTTDGMLNELERISNHQMRKKFHEKLTN